MLTADRGTGQTADSSSTNSGYAAIAYRWISPNGRRSVHARKACVGSVPSIPAPKSFSNASGEVSWSHQRATVGSVSHFASSGKSARCNRLKVISPTLSAYEAARPDSPGKIARSARAAARFGRICTEPMIMRGRGRGRARWPPRRGSRQPPCSRPGR